MLRFGMFIVLIAAAVGIAGCASMPGGAKDDAGAIAIVVDQWGAALTAHDLVSLMPLYSENFSDADGNDKATLRDFLADIIEQGMLDDLEVITDDIVVTIDEDAATYNGILLSSVMGAVTVDLTLAREEDGWKIVSMLAT